MSVRLSRFVLILVAVLLAAASAYAQEQDLLGVFFQPDGTRRHAQTFQAYEYVDCYLLLLNPSAPAGVTRWECRIEVVGSSGSARAFWNIVPSAMNLDTAPTFSVIEGVPQPGADVQVLATGRVVVPSPEEKIEIFLQPHPAPTLVATEDGYVLPAPCYEPAGRPGMVVPLRQSSGCSPAPVAVINPDGATPVVNLACLPAELDFGAVLPGQQNERSITLRNTGQMTFAGEIVCDQPAFLVRFEDRPPVSRVPFQLAPGGQMEADVLFRPPEFGSYPMALQIRACDESFATVACAATSVPAQCACSTDRLVFGNVTVGQSRELTFTVRNDGGGILAGDFSSDSEAFDIMENRTIELAYGEEATCLVEFTAHHPGLHEAVIRFGDGECVEIACAGTGIPGPPFCSTWPYSYQPFGTIVVGETTTKTITVRNVGGSPFSGKVPKTCGAFRVISGAGPFTLEPLGHLLLEVEFAPQATGLHRYSLQFSDGLCNTIFLEGRGRPAEATCRLSATRADFRYALLNAPSPPLGIHIKNVGNDTLTGVVPVGCGDFHVIDGAGEFRLGYNDVHVVAVQFIPQSLGFHECILTFGDLCDVVRCFGTAVDTVPVCTISSNSYDYYDPEQNAVTFHPAKVGSGDIVDLIIRNEGFAPLSLNLQMDCENFRVDFDLGAYELQPGDRKYVCVVFAPFESGEHSCTLRTGCRLCGDVALHGLGLEPTYRPHWNHLGIYFDPAAETSTLQAAPGQIVTAYLCLVNARETSGAAGWECRLEQDGDWPLGNWRLHGEAENVLSPPSFGVMLHEPLPQQEVVVLVEFDVVAGASGQTLLRAKAVDHASVPGRATYRSAAAPDQPIRLTVSSATLAVGDGAAAQPVPAAVLAEIAAVEPQTYLLHANNPNPFNPATTIRYDLPRPAVVSLVIYDVTGRRVRQLLDSVSEPAGRHAIRWDGRDDSGRGAASGTYFYSLTSGPYSETRRMLLLR